MTERCKSINEMREEIGFPPVRNKVAVSKETAKAIESALELGGTKSWVLKVHASNNGWQNNEHKILNELDMLTMAEALINGYEVKKTPEEKLLEYYNSFTVCDWSNNYSRGFQLGVIRGIRSALEILDIEINGINKEETK